MMLSLDPETPEQAVARLTLELQHVDEQCRTAHAIAQGWKARYLACESERARLEKELTPKRAEAAQQRIEERIANLNARFHGLFADDQDSEP
jgi:hypothetical protein